MIKLLKLIAMDMKTIIAAIFEIRNKQKEGDVIPFEIDYFDLNQRAKLRDDSIRLGIRNCNQLTKVCLEDIERTNTPGDPLNSAPNIAFGHINKPWEIFKSQMQPEDELHEFSYQQNDIFGYSRQVSGYVFLRDGNPGLYFVLVEC